MTNATDAHPPSQCADWPQCRPTDRSNRSVGHYQCRAAGQSPSFLSVCSRRCRLLQVAGVLQQQQPQQRQPWPRLARSLARLTTTRRDAVRCRRGRRLRGSGSGSSSSSSSSTAGGAGSTGGGGGGMAEERSFPTSPAAARRVCVLVGVSIKRGEWVPVHGGGALEGAAPAPSERSARALARARKQ